MIFSIILLATSLSLDAFGVGMAYGFRKIKIPFISKLVLCFFSVFYSALALTLGRSLSNILSVKTSKIIGLSILFAIGLWIILQALRKSPQESFPDQEDPLQDKPLFRLGLKSLGITIQVIKNPSRGDVDHSGIIDIRESLLLGLALSTDAIGASIGSALTGFDHAFIPFAVGLFQLALLYAGTLIGEKFAHMSSGNKRIFAFLPGVLLIFLALIRF